MCGFVASQSYQNNYEAMVRSIAFLSHRGPDSHSIVAEHHSKNTIPNIAFAHARLAITGVSNGTQPIMTNNKKSYAMVNGEFYNYEPLKNKLIADGYVFQTNSDSEMVPALYQTYGLSFIDHLEGEFSLMIYDIEKDIWILARDTFGTKPLCWTFNHNGFYVASETKALQAFFPLELDRDALFFSQNFQYLPQSSTFFKNIHMCKPGHIMVLKNGTVISENNFRALPNKTQPIEFQKAVSTVDSLLTNSVKSRIPQEVPFCAHLSGGIDSSAVCAIAKDYGLKDVFTVSFVESDFHNELPLAQETAKFLNLNLNVVEVTQKQLLHSFADSVYHAEGFAINGHISATYLLNKAIKEAGFKVALSGQGSDEIFMGYSHLKKDYMDFGKIVHNNFSKEASYISGFQIPDGKSFNLPAIKQLFGFTPTWIDAKSSMANKLSQMWSDDFLNRAIPDSIFANEFVSSLGDKSLNSYTPLHQSSLAWIKYCFSGYILKILDDAQSMAWGIENRLPFLDTQLSQFAFSLPDDVYFDGSVEKHILRTVFKDRLPSNVIHKTKQSFMSSPMVNSLQDKDNFDYVYSVLNNDNFLAQEIYNKDAVNKSLLMWRDSNNPAYEPIMMTMMGIAHFCDKFNLKG